MDKGIYHDGISAEAINCEVVLSDHKIYIYFKEQNRDLLIWDLKALESCAYYGATLKIIKEKTPGQSLECSGEVAKNIFNDYLNPKVEVPLGRPKKVISFFVVSLLSILAIVVLCYVYLIPWIAGKATGFVSEDLEIKLGSSLSEVYLKEGELNDSAGFYANKFVQALDFNTKYPIHVYVIQSKEINAFAVPGGNIFVYSGLIKKMSSYEELVALLGHEATHIIKRHSLKSILSSAASGVILSSIFGDMSALSLWAISKADELKQLNYSRELESEADQNGLKLMIDNKVSPKGMLDLLVLLKKESVEMPGMMKYLSTHPDTDSRISAVKSDQSTTKFFPPDRNMGDSFQKIKNAIH